MTHTVVRPLAIVVCALFCAGCDASPPVIPKLTIVNRTSYDLEVRASNSPPREWVLLGRVPRGRTTVREQIEDLGDTWVFRFDFPGPVRGGELRVARDVLERGRWRVEVPEDVEQRLRSQGVKVSPALR